MRGKETKTTVPDKALPCPADRVNRQFRAPCPNALRVSDFTYVVTWQGFVYVVLIGAFAGSPAGCQGARTAQAGVALDALEQALHDRHPVRGGGLVHHCDRGIQLAFSWLLQYQSAPTAGSHQGPLPTLSAGCLARPPVQCRGHRREVFGAVHAEARSLWKAPPQQPVRVLVHAALPRAVRIAETHLDADGDPQLGMLAHLRPLVPG